MNHAVVASQKPHFDPSIPALGRREFRHRSGSAFAVKASGIASLSLCKQVMAAAWAWAWGAAGCAGGPARAPRLSKNRDEFTVHAIRSRSVVEGVVLHHVASWCASRVDPGRGEVFGDAVGGEADLPVTLMDQAVMIWAKKHTIFVAGGSALRP